MSSSQSYSYTSSSTSYSSSSSNSGGNGGHTQSQTTRSTYNDRDGGYSERITTETGKPTVVEQAQIPVGGGGSGTRHISGGDDGVVDGRGRIEDVTDAEKDARRPEEGALSEADRRYLEAMEDEYAKREGGA